MLLSQCIIAANSPINPQITFRFLDEQCAMAKRLVIKLRDGQTLEYGHETGLKAVSTAIETELGSDYEKLVVRIIGDHSWLIDAEGS